jgi:hypothetical protein
MLLLATSWTSAAHASPGATNADAERWFQEGRALAARGAYAEACQRFERSLALEETGGALLNYGDCLEHLGKPREAWVAYGDAVRVFEEAADPRASFAKSRQDTVAVKLVTVDLVVEDATISGLLVEIDGRPLSVTPTITDHVAPGTFTITAHAPGRTPFIADVHGEPGAELDVTIPALRVEAATVATAPPPSPAVRRRVRSRVRVALAVGAAGGAALAGSVVFAVAARGRYRDADCTSGDPLVCSPAGARDVDAAYARAHVATGLAIGGGALVAAGLVLYWTSPREGVTVRPVASSDSAGVLVGGRF